MKGLGILFASLVACVVLVTTNAVSETLKSEGGRMTSRGGATDEAKAGSLQVAAKSSKPREIVVVGSKVKEVIREAGLRSDAAFDQALESKVDGMLQEAFSRARANGRTELRVEDLSCLCSQGGRSQRVVFDGTNARERIEAAGFTANNAFLSAVSEKVHEMLGTAVKRAKSNGRGTVRPYDL